VAAACSHHAGARCPVKRNNHSVRIIFAYFAALIALKTRPGNIMADCSESFRIRIMKASLHIVP
jgi:hypothetical protein